MMNHHPRRHVQIRTISPAFHFHLAAWFLFIPLAFAQADLNGKWDVTATPEGKKPLKLDAQLEHQGADLKGTVNSPLGSGPVQNAVVGNPDVAFQFLVGKYTFDVKGVVQNGEIRGTFTGPRNMKGEFLAKRAASVAIAALPAAVVSKPPEGVETGELGKAGYRIDIPANYNGQLVIYCHGYGQASKFRKSDPPTALMKAFLDAGFALAQSGYSATGWAVKEGVEESEELRKYFVTKYGKPRRSWVTGHSMGGTITLATIETYADNYDGALQMCGPVGPTLNTFQRRIFDMLVVYDYYFPNVIGSPVDPMEADEEFPIRVQKETNAYPDRLDAFQRWSGLKNDEEIGKVVAFYSQIQRELIARAGGNPFDNRNTLYQGSPDDGILNRGVKRYAADTKAADYLKKYYTPTGKLKQPVVSLHTIYDPLVPAWAANEYGETLRLNGSADLYVQRFVSRNGHCAFTPKETMNAFRDLVSWKESGKRPEGGEQK